ncbi:biotin synthase BioB [Enterococcus lemanii]|uniref:Biotin synthase n=1 Tax=Enterococcus lemanii TaxID=1159752 RepID=A0ABV9MV72_9ENTE|nr:biotin synthase BioB [Enterococcus lemanii]MBM7708468.1 biotin synthase [Enterococcus lemanii]
MFENEEKEQIIAHCLTILGDNADWWHYYGEAIKVKQQATKNQIRLNSLLNAKSGLCKEDCGYCAQSQSSTAPIESYRLIPKAEIIRRALIAKKNQASTFCIATSGTKPSKKELLQLGEAVKEIKATLQMEICLSTGLLDEEQISYLKNVGVDRINHNLNTPKENYPIITTTHTYEDRVATLEHLNKEQMNICSGFICGMGETDEQLVALAFELDRLKPYSLPINFLLPIEGTKLAQQNELTPMKCLKILTMMRLLFPKTELRISAGREFLLGELQHLALLIVDSIFLGNYLTEQGATKEEDFNMLEALGLEIVGAPYD